MIDFGKQNILGVGINAVDYESAVDKIADAAREGRPFAVSALAVHGVMTGALDSAHRHRLNKLDLVVPDGHPVRWAMKWLYRVNLPDRVYGPNLTLEVCRRAAKEGLGIYLYGSQSDVLKKFEENLKTQFPNLIISGTQASLFRQVSEKEQLEIAEKIEKSGASIVFVGLGCPRQEIWVYENRNLISMPLMAVGAAFDFHAGTVSQAPKWMQDRGLEWFYRLLQEPKRLWQRYLYLNPLYLSMIALQFLKFRTREIDDAFAPIEQQRFG